MRDAYVYIFSTIPNGALTKASFKRSFKTSSALPKIGTVILLGSEGEPKGTLKQGVVTDVRETENSFTVGTGDEPTEGLRDCLINNNGDKNYKETSLPVW